MQPQNICLIAGGISDRNHRLQPWCYLLNVARGLIEQRHQVTVLSDGLPAKQLEKSGGSCVRLVDGIPVCYIGSVSDPLWRTNAQLQSTVTGMDPDIVLLHVGLTSFAHQRLNHWQRNDGTLATTLGIFTSPLYSLDDFQQIGLTKTIRNRALSGVHFAGTLLPKRAIRHRAINSALRGLVTQTETTSQQILARGLWRRPIDVIPPGIDAEWRTPDPASIRAMRAELGFTPDDSVVVYFGSPTPLRGMHTLLAAFRAARRNAHSTARRTESSLKLLVLSRRHADELMEADTQLRTLLADAELAPHVKIVSGFLAKDLLVRHIAASDIVALPFELVPSDAPLSLLEAQALGKPVVTSDLVCLPELIDAGPKFLARPADVDSLAGALREAAAYHAQNGPNSAPPAIRSWQDVGRDWNELVNDIHDLPELMP